MLAVPRSATMHNLAAQGLPTRNGRVRTRSCGELRLMADTVESDDRSRFVQEYNRLAKKVRKT